MAVCVDATPPPNPADRENLVREKAKNVFVALGPGRRVYLDDVFENVEHKVEDLTEEEVVSAVTALEAAGEITKHEDENTGSEYYRLSLRQVQRQLTVPMPNNITDFFGDTDKNKVEALRRIYIIETFMQAWGGISEGMTFGGGQDDHVGYQRTAMERWKKVYDSIAKNPQAAGLTGWRFDDTKTDWANTRHRKRAGTFYWIDDFEQMVTQLVDVMNKSTGALNLGDFYTLPAGVGMLQQPRPVESGRGEPESNEMVAVRLLQRVRDLRGQSSPSDDRKVLALYIHVRPWNGTMNLADFIQLVGNETARDRSRLQITRVNEDGGAEVSFRNLVKVEVTGGTDSLPIGASASSQTAVRSRVEQTLSPIYVPTGTNNYGIARHVAETMFKGFRGALEIMSAAVQGRSNAELVEAVESVQPDNLQRSLKTAAKRLAEDIAERKTKIEDVLQARAPKDGAGLDSPVPEALAETRDPLTQSLVRWAVAKSGEKKGVRGLLVRAYLQDGLDYSKLTKDEKKEITEAASGDSSTFRAYLRRSDGTAARLQPRAGGEFELLTPTGSGAKAQSVSKLLKDNKGAKIEIWADPAVNVVKIIADQSKAFKETYVAAHTVVSGLLGGAVEEDIQNFLNRNTDRDVMRHFEQGGMFFERKAGRQNPAVKIDGVADVMQYANEIAAWEAVRTAEMIYGSAEDFFTDLLANNDRDAVQRAFGLENYSGFGNEATLSDTLSAAFRHEDFNNVTHDVVGLTLPDSRKLDGEDELIDYAELGAGNKTLGLFKIAGLDLAATRNSQDVKLTRLGRQILFRPDTRWMTDETARRIRRMTDSQMTDEERRMRISEAAARSSQTDISMTGSSADSTGSVQQDLNFTTTALHDIWMRFGRLGRAFAAMAALARKLDYINMFRDPAARGQYTYVIGGMQKILENPAHRREGGSSLFHEVAHRVENMLNTGRNLAAARRRVSGHRGLQTLRAGGRTVGGARLDKADADLEAASLKDSNASFTVSLYDVLLRKAYFRTWRPSDPANMLDELGMTEQDVDEIIGDIVRTQDVTQPSVQEEMIALVKEDMARRVAVLSLEHNLMHTKLTWDIRRGNIEPEYTGRGENPLPPGYFDEIFWLHRELGNIGGQEQLEAIVKGDKDYLNRFSKAVGLYMTYMDKGIIPNAYWSSHTETFSQFFEEMAAMKIEDNKAMIPNYDPFLFNVTGGSSGLGYSREAVRNGLNFFERMFGALQIEKGRVTGVAKTDFRGDKFMQVDQAEMANLVRRRGDHITGAAQTYESLPAENRAPAQAPAKGKNRLELVVHGNDAGLLRDGEMIAKVSVPMSDALAMLQLSFTDGLTPLNVIHAIEQGLLKETPDGRQISKAEQADLNATLRKFTNQGSTLGKQLRALGAIVPALLQKAGAFISEGKGAASIAKDSVRAISRAKVPFVPYLGEISIGGVPIPPPMTPVVSSELLGALQRPGGITIDPDTGAVTGFPEAEKPKKTPKTKAEKEAAAALATKQLREYLELDEQEFYDLFIGGSQDGNSPLNSLQFQEVVRILFANTGSYSLTEEGLLPVLHREVTDLTQNLANRMYREAHLSGLGMGTGKTRIMAMIHRVRATLARKEAAAYMQTARTTDDRLNHHLEAERRARKKSEKMEHADAAHLHLWRSDPEYRKIVSRGQTMTITGGAAKEELMYGFYKAQYEVGNMRDGGITSAEQTVKAFTRDGGPGGHGVIDQGTGFRLIRFTEVRKQILSGFKRSGNELSPNDGVLPDQLVPRIGDVVYIETYQQLTQGMSTIREHEIKPRERHKNDPLGPELTDANKADTMFRQLAIIPKNVRLMLSLLGMPSVALKTVKDSDGNITEVKQDIDPLGRHKDELDPKNWDWWDGTLIFDESDQMMTLAEASEQKGGTKKKKRSDTESSSTAEIGREIQRLLPRAHVGYFTGTPFKSSASVIAMERVLMQAMTNTTPTTSELKQNIDRNPESRSDLMEFLVRTGKADYWAMDIPEDQVQVTDIDAPSDVKEHITTTYNGFSNLLGEMQGVKPENAPVTVVIDNANGLNLASDGYFVFERVEEAPGSDGGRGKKNLGDLTIRSADPNKLEPFDDDNEEKRISTWRRAKQDINRVVERMGYHKGEMTRWAALRSNGMPVPDKDNSVIYVMNRFEDAAFSRYITHLVFSKDDDGNPLAQIITEGGEKYIEMDERYYPTQNRLLNFELTWAQRTSVVNHVQLEYESKQQGGKFDPSQVRASVERLGFNDYMWARHKDASIHVVAGEGGRGSDGGLRDKMRLENNNIVVTMREDGTMYASVLPQDANGFMQGFDIEKAKKSKSDRGEEDRVQVDITRAEIAAMMGVREDGLIFVGTEEGSGMTAEVFAKPDALLSAPGHQQANQGRARDLINGFVHSELANPYPADAELAVDEISERLAQEGVWVGEISGRNKAYVPKSETAEAGTRRVKIVGEPDLRREHDITHFMTNEGREKRAMLVQFDSGSRGIELDKWRTEQKNRIMVILEPSGEAAKNAQMSGRIIRNRSLPGANWVHYANVDVPPSPIDFWKAGAKVADMSKTSTGMEDTMLASLSGYPDLTFKKEDEVFFEAYLETLEEWHETPNNFGGLDVNDALSIILGIDDFNYSNPEHQKKLHHWETMKMPFKHYRLGKLPNAAAMAWLNRFKANYDRKKQEYNDRGLIGVHKLPGKIALLGGSVQAETSGSDTYKLVFAKHNEQRVHEDYDVVFGGAIRGAGEDEIDFGVRQRAWERNVDVQRVTGETDTGKKFIMHLYLDRNKEFVERTTENEDAELDEDDEFSTTHKVYPLHVLTFEDIDGSEGRMLDYQTNIVGEEEVDNYHPPNNVVVQNIPSEEARDMWNEVRLKGDAGLGDSHFNSMLIFIHGSIINSPVFGMRDAWAGFEEGETVSRGGLRKVALEAEPDLAEQLGGVRDGALTTGWLLIGPEGGQGEIETHTAKEFYTGIAPLLIKGLEESGVPDFTRHKITAGDLKAWLREQILQNGSQQYVLRRSRAGLALEVDLADDKKSLVIKGMAFKREWTDVYPRIAEEDQHRWNALFDDSDAKVGGMVGHAAKMLARNEEETTYTDEQMLMLLQTMVGLPEELLANAARKKP